MLRLPLVRVPIPGVSVFRLHLAKRVMSPKPPLSRAPLSLHGWYGGPIVGLASYT